MAILIYLELLLDTSNLGLFLLKEVMKSIVAVCPEVSCFVPLKAFL